MKRGVIDRETLQLNIPRASFHRQLAKVTSILIGGPIYEMNLSAYLQPPKPRLALSHLIFSTQNKLVRASIMRLYFQPQKEKQKKNKC